MSRRTLITRAAKRKEPTRAGKLSRVFFWPLAAGLLTGCNLELPAALKADSSEAETVESAKPASGAFADVSDEQMAAAQADQARIHQELAALEQSRAPADSGEAAGAVSSPGAQPYRDDARTVIIGNWSDNEAKPVASTQSRPQSVEPNPVQPEAQPTGRMTSAASPRQAGKPAATTATGSASSWGVQFGAFRELVQLRQAMIRGREVARSVFPGRRMEEKVERVGSGILRAQFIGLNEQDARTLCDAFASRQFECIVKRPMPKEAALTTRLPEQG